MKIRKEILSILLGLLITLASGVIPVKVMMGATQYGVPFQWLVRVVVHPSINPWRILAPYAILDILFWTIVCYVISCL